MVAGPVRLVGHSVTGSVRPGPVTICTGGKGSRLEYDLFDTEGKGFVLTDICLKK